MVENNFWLLDCAPRPVQIEATYRSMMGVSWFTDGGTPLPNPVYYPHHPEPAQYWAHYLEMRLGKTPVALNEYALIYKAHDGARGLIFSPNQYKRQWAEEARRFGVEGNIMVYESSKFKQCERNIETWDSGLIVANYELLNHIKHRELLHFWLRASPTIVIFDESAMMKNPQSGFFKHAFKMVVTRKVDYVRLLSGLPAPQGPHDLWSQMRMLHNPRLQLKHIPEKKAFVNFTTFKARFCRTVPGFQGRLKVVGTKNPLALEDVLMAVSMRAKRKDWGTKIASDYEIVSPEPDPVLQNQYALMDRDFVVALEDGGVVTAEQITTKHMKLQQISSGFIYDEDGKFQPLLPFDKLPKTKDLLFRLNALDGKILVIAHYKYTMLALFHMLRPFQPCIIAGSQLMKDLGRDIQVEKEAFNTIPGYKVLIGQSSALKYGHTLMGTDEMPCLSTCFFENTYSLDTRSQVEERNQGHGQQAGIYIWDYASTGVETKIISALQRKKSVADAIMSHYAAPVPPSPATSLPGGGTCA